MAKFIYLETTPKKKTKSHSGRNWRHIKFAECALPLRSVYFCLPRVSSKIKNIKMQNCNFSVAYYDDDDKRGHPQAN